MKMDYSKYDLMEAVERIQAEPYNLTAKLEDYDSDYYNIMVEWD